MRFGLAFKIAVLTTIIVAIIMAFVGFLFGVRQENTMRTEMKKEGSEDQPDHCFSRNARVPGEKNLTPGLFPGVSSPLSPRWTRIYSISSSWTRMERSKVLQSTPIF
jgi:hypothetical protein